MCRVCFVNVVSHRCFCELLNTLAVVVRTLCSNAVQDSYNYSTEYTHVE